MHAWMRITAAALMAALPCVGLPAANLAHGQDYPTRPIRVLVPAQPGGIGDILPRIMGQKLAETSSATIVVEPHRRRRRGRGRGRRQCLARRLSATPR
jgi:tripartite-type tricarboxylate transporter receptor subunit TctC